MHAARTHFGHGGAAMRPRWNVRSVTDRKGAIAGSDSGKRGLGKPDRHRDPAPEFCRSVLIRGLLNGLLQGIEREAGRGEGRHRAGRRTSDAEEEVVPRLEVSLLVQHDRLPFVLL